MKQLLKLHIAMVCVCLNGILCAQELTLEPLSPLIGANKLQTVNLSPSGEIYVSTNNQLYVSADAIEWDVVPHENISSIDHLHFFSDGEFLIRNDNKIYRKSNNDSWEVIDTAQITTYNYIYYTSIINDTIFISDERGFLVSVDRGENYQIILPEAKYFTNVQISDDYIYIFKSNRVIILNKSFRVINEFSFEQNTALEEYYYNAVTYNDKVIHYNKSYFFGAIGPDQNFDGHFSLHPSIEGADFLSNSTPLPFYKAKEDIMGFRLIFRDSLAYISNVKFYDDPDNRYLVEVNTNNGEVRRVKEDARYYILDNGEKTIAHNNEYIYLIDNLQSPNLTQVLPKLFDLKCIDNLRITDNNEVYLYNCKVEEDQQLFSKTADRLLSYNTNSREWDPIELGIDDFKIKDFPSDQLFITHENTLHKYSEDFELEYEIVYDSRFEVYNFIPIMDNLIAVTTVDGSQYVTKDKGVTWLTLNNIEILEGEYQKLNDKLLYKNKVFNPEDFTYTNYIDDNIDQVLIVDDNLIHLHNSKGTSPSYHMNANLDITEVSESPIGHIFRGPNREDTYVINYEDKSIYYRPDLSSDYNQITTDIASQDKMISARTDSDNNLYFLLESEDGIRSVHKSNIECNSSSVIIENNILITICEGDNYNGYIHSGLYTDNYVTEGGCDSIVQLELIVEEQIQKSIQIQICQGQSYRGLTTSGEYDILENNTEGCPDEITLDLQVLPIAYDTSAIVSICNGTSYNSHTQPGNYNDTLLNGNTCYIENLSLEVIETSIVDLYMYICDGESFLGHIDTGIYVDTLINANGCDSIITTNLNRQKPYQLHIGQEICQGDYYNGHNTSGLYTDRYTAINGCDSVVTVELVVTDQYYTYQKEQLCKGETFKGYNQSGTYIDTLTSYFGCDSIVELSLDIGECINECSESFYLSDYSGDYTYSSTKFADNKLVVYFFKGSNFNNYVENEVTVYERKDSKWEISDFPILINTSVLTLYKDFALSYLYVNDELSIWNKDEQDIWIKDIKLQLSETRITAADISTDLISYSDFNGSLYILDYKQDILEPVKISNFRIDQIKFIGDKILCRRRIGNVFRLLLFELINNTWNYTEIVTKVKDTEEFCHGISVYENKVLVNSKNYLHLFTYDNNQWQEEILKSGENYLNAGIYKDILSYSTSIYEPEFTYEKIGNSSNITTSFKLEEFVWPNSTSRSSVSDSFIVTTYHKNLGLGVLETIPINKYFEDADDDGFGDRTDTSIDTIQVTICEGKSYEGYYRSGTYTLESFFGECTEATVLELTVLDYLHKNCIQTPRSSDDTFPIPYPNPVITSMRISLEEDIGEYTVTITDISGNLVTKYKENNIDTEVDLSHVPKGVYLVRINNSIYNYVCSIVKI